MNKKLLNWVFIVQLILFGLIVTGILPRSVVPYLAVALVAYMFFVSLENATVFFVRSIPFFWLTCILFAISTIRIKPLSN